MSLFDPGLAGLRAWYGTASGQVAARLERAVLRDVLPDLFGYHLLQVGDSVYDLTESSRISHRFVVGLDGEVAGEPARAVARPDALPILANSVDLVLLPHTLEFSPNPHGILREVERVLIGEGYVLIIGFNPWSLFGLSRRLLGWRGRAPWNGSFLGIARVKDWLKLLGFDIDRVIRLSFRPPLAQPKWLARLEFLEGLGGHFWPVFGNVYAVLARKRLVSARPIRTAWKVRRGLAAGGVIEPTARWPEG
ncbi:MAG: methyltransferase domain-containing protein [Gammaproteobacteria bacterium]